MADKTQQTEGRNLKFPPKGPIVKLTRPFQRFAAREASGGLVLMACTVAALVWANSPWSESYEALWHVPLTLAFGGSTLRGDLHFWVNDALMAVFFFVVGLEIKREFLVGELATARKAALPIVAAIGGVIAPALLYRAMNPAGPAAAGWGIPMATDIAFVIGVMAVLGDRVPISLKVFLIALAIVDDIAAVLVIALFYTPQIHWDGIIAAALLIAVLITANRSGVRHPLPYGLLGLLLWGAVLQSGVHATLAGILLAMTIPSRTEIHPVEFLDHSRAVLNYFEQASPREKEVLKHFELQVAIAALEDSCEKAQPPLHRLEWALHPWVTFLVMPVFALANAGVAFDADFLKNATHPVAVGVVLGLVIGKPLGIMLASWLAVVLGLASLPNGVKWGQVHGAAWLGGIGFTMSLFIAGLAFRDAELLAISKLGILAASVIASIAGMVLLSWRKPAAA